MSGPTYFLSDLHMADPSKPSTARLLDLIGSWRGAAEAVYLVGDAFDFWLSYRSSMFTGAFPLLHRLAELAEHGTRVIWQPGNHDPDPGPFLPSIGIEVMPEPGPVDIGGHTVWLEHGDTIDPRGWHHSAICRFVRHPWSRAIARRFHPDFAWRMSRRYNEGKAHHYDEPLPQGLIDDWFPARVAAGADVVVIGHYHRAVHHIAGEARLFGLGDWLYQRTYLRFDGDFTLLRDRGPAQPPEPLPPGDHAPDPDPVASA